MEKGICLGVSAAAALTYLRELSLSKWGVAGKDFRTPYFFRTDNLDYLLRLQSDDFDMTFSEWLQALQIWQESYKAAITYEKHKNKKGYQQIINKTKLFAQTYKNPVIVYITGESKNKKSSHAILPYRVEESPEEIKVFVYDCNYVGDENKFISFKLNSKSEIIGMVQCRIMTMLTKWMIHLIRIRI